MKEKIPTKIRKLFKVFKPNLTRLEIYSGEKMYTAILFTSLQPTVIHYP